MEHLETRRTFQGQIGTGCAALALSFAAAAVLWPAWSLAVKALYQTAAAQGLAAADPKLAGQLTAAVARGTFFWMVINTWIWFTLVMGNHGKNAQATRQPWIGIRYTFLALGAGVAAFFALIGFLGLWWTPFSAAVMFTPGNAAEVKLALEGWEASNFYALAVIVAQIPLVSLFQKWPFAGRAEKPMESFATLALGTALTLLAWMAMIVPSWLKLSLGEHPAVTAPFGGWPAFAAFCQAYVIFAIMPVEGGELYPMKLFAKKQPLMGIAGVTIALAAGFIMPPLVKAAAVSLGIGKGLPPDAVAASLELSVIVFMLAWHHLFDDYPGPRLVPNTFLRIACRATAWFGGGAIYGLLWLTYFKSIPFGANDLGMGVPPMGILAGQFAPLMTLLFLNTFFDKWPLVRQVSSAPDRAKEPVPEGKAVPAQAMID
ncbi:MAG TPA: hypothetical protein VJ550_16455 [Geomonas sp.]|nr:hypothetical protein [Geomonas sp.]